MIRRTLWVLAILLLPACSVYAKNGVVNLADYATITNPGSYRVTRDIVLAGGNAIDVKANDVTIDLNGHMVAGLTIFFPNDAGIYQYPGYRNLTILNGTVIGDDGAGIKAEGDGTRIMNVRVRESSAGALVLGDNAQVDGCLINSNVLTGGSLLIEAGTRCRITDTMIFENSGNTIYGVYVLNNAIIKSLSISRNRATAGFTGIMAGEGSVITACNVFSNSTTASSLNGIYVGEGCVISKSSVTFNRASGSLITGFFADRGTRISQCIAAGNRSSSATSRGFWHEGDGSLESCIARDNDATLGYGFYVRSKALVSIRNMEIPSVIVWPNSMEAMALT